MSQRKNYSRYFIILQEDEKGYGLSSDKTPTGYAKLEVKNGKCKITFYVQNLKKEMKPYYIALICNKKDEKKLIRLGQLNIDNAGRAEVSKEFDSNDIAGSGIGVSKIGGAAIAKFDNLNVNGILSGFTSADIPKDWEKYALVNIEDDRKPQKKEKDKEKEVKVEVPKKKEKEKHQVEEDIKDFDKYESEVEKIAFEKRVEEENKPEEENKAREKDKPKEEKPEENKKVKKEDKVERTKKAEVEKEEKVELIEKQPPIDEKNERLNSYTIDKTEAVKQNTIEKSNKEHRDFFKDIVEDLDEFDDYFPEISRAKWYAVNVYSIDDMYRADTYNKYTVIYYPMINYYPYIIRYNHYIMGYKFDRYGKVKYVMYGIPGTKNEHDQPFGGKYGFVSFAKTRKGEDTELGYWLLFYDFSRSVVVIPKDK